MFPWNIIITETKFIKDPYFHCLVENYFSIKAYDGLLCMHAEFVVHYIHNSLKTENEPQKACYSCLILRIFCNVYSSSALLYNTSSRGK